MFRWLLSLLLVLSADAALGAPAFDARGYVSEQIAAHPGLTGTYVLEKGEEALLARAWLADHARRSIEVQYFIWSTDNIGILASEALLRAADRGVHVRVIVDDLLIDAPDKSLLALALHPNIEIRIYNPVHSVGVTWRKRLLNVVTNFRGANQRMHDKTFVVDGEVAIVGGRNMADEYFDFDQEYNFRDRDALVLGTAVTAVRASFERFWNSGFTAPVEALYDGYGILKKNVSVTDREVQAIYADMHRYAASTEHFEPEIRAAIEAIPSGFPRLAQQLTWGRVEFVCDEPGKNDGKAGLGGGGLSSAALANLLDDARQEILIQSPYLVLSDAALDVFKRVRARGVRVRIHTNSLASTDNIQAFSGYRNQREELLELGIEIYEFKPDSKVQRDIMQRYVADREDMPIFALHAKTLVIDDEIVFIGTFNLDPRSENLNTEVGVAIHDPQQAKSVTAAIERDMAPENSWRATDDPDQFASQLKRAHARLWQWLPIKPLL